MSADERGFGISELPEAKKPEPFYFKQAMVPTKEEIIRMELMMDVNKWAHNDEYVAKQKALILIDVLEKQFDIQRLQPLHDSDFDVASERLRNNE